MIGTLVLAAATTGAWAHGALHRNSPLFGRVLARVQCVNGERRVALTFDDGPNPVATPLVLDALAREGVAATFFLLGRHVDNWPELARRVADAGHAIGNHGYHHRKLHLSGPAYTRVDMALGADAIERATGVRPRLFRAPHGFRAPWTTAIARDMGFRSVGWSAGVWDSDRPGTDVIATRTLAAARPGAVLLLHDGDGYDPEGDRTQTAAALPRIVGELRARGFTFVTLPS